jgi:UDP-N-acetylmuramoylalanine--D-glutamate ligase
MQSVPFDRTTAVPEGLAQLDLGPDSSVLIVGLGKTGFSIARFLATQGLRFAVTDTRDEPPFLREFRETYPDAAVFLGGFKSSTFEAATHIIVSPGVPLSEPSIRAACERGQPVFGDLDLFACVARAPVLAITGSNGKSTVTTLVGMMGEADGRETRVGGNLGTPMLELLDDSASLYVLELSSFQLECSHKLEPIAATVLNISPDHMDRYPDLSSYAAAKKRIFHGNGLMVLNRDDATVVGMAETGRRMVWFSLESPSVEYGVGFRNGEEWIVAQGSPLIPVAEIKLQGRHNLANALAALALGDAAGLSHEAMKKVLREFSGLDHRAQWVRELHGVTWINDSKATNVGACMAALSGMRRPVILIAGGDGKDADFTVMRSIVAEKVKSAVLMGRDAGLLQTAFGDIVDTVTVADMHEAVLAAQRLAQSGDVVLLAPACASLDQYKDYQERGRIFSTEVRGLNS